MDAKTLKVFKRIPLSGRPNNVAVAKDGKSRLCRDRRGAGRGGRDRHRLAHQRQEHPVKGGIHNVYVTPDGKYAVAGSIPASTINVIDTATNTRGLDLDMSAGIRPMAFTQNADGSTKEIIVQLSDFHGFAVVDFATRKEVRRITLPDPAGKQKETEGIQGSPSHGLAITPDGKMLWATSK